MQQESIEKLVALELKSAEAKFPKHNSAHESYAVLREEYDETMIEMEYITEEIECLWAHVKKNDTKQIGVSIDELKETSIKLIEEAIQFSAMCDRFKKDILS